jgi:predicted transcriptional regulator
MPQSTSESPDALAMTGEIVSAFVSNNSLPLAELPTLIQSVHTGLVKIISGATTPPEREPEAAAPAVSVRKSITPDYLICLDDGRKFKPQYRTHTRHHFDPRQLAFIPRLFGIRPPT